MDRESLEELLNRGMSLEAIGRRLGRHESTVAYWVEKHGLVPAYRDKHAAKGGVDRDELKALVDAGMSTAQIGRRVGLSKTTVRHWLREYGLATQWATRSAAARNRQPTIEFRCAKHGLTAFRLSAAGAYRCGRCQTEAVTRRRRKVKQTLVEEAGGVCVLSGYDGCLAALQFHHLVPAEKSYSLSHRGVTRSMASARAEARKCALLCANCHAEVEAGLVSLGQGD